MFYATDTARYCGRQRSCKKKRLNNFKIYIQIKKDHFIQHTKCVSARLKKYKKVSQIEKK